MNSILTRTLLAVFTATIAVACAPPIESSIRGRVQESRDNEAYSKYRNDLERANLEREKARQAPLPILARDEWAKAEAAKRDAASKK